MEETYNTSKPSYVAGGKGQAQPAFNMRVSPRAAAAAIEAVITAWPMAPLYAERSVSDLFSVTANSVDIPIIINNPSYHHGQFDMGTGFADVEVEILNNALTLSEGTKIRVSPEKLDIKSRVDTTKNTVHFTLPKDGYYIVKIGTLRELVLIADPPQSDVPALKGNSVHSVINNGANSKGTDAAGTTTAFQKALDKSGKDGKTVVVPPGVYMLKNIVLPSNSKLYLAPGSVLRFTAIASDYKRHYFKSSQNRNVTWWISTAFNSKDIKVWGRGIIDGNGHQAFHNAKIGNNLLVPISTRNFYLEGITFRNSAAWCVTVIDADDVLMKNVKVLNRLDMGENDSYDVMHSNNVRIQHSLGISLDDPYSTKTWMIAPNTLTESWPQTAARPMSNVLIDDAVAWTRCFGLKVGQGVNWNQQDITFRNAVVYQAAIGIGINHRWGTANAEYILFENIDIEDTPLMLENRSSWEAIFTEGADGKGAGQVKHVTIKNVRVRRPGLTRAQLTGLNEMKIIKDVLFENIRMPDMDRDAQTLQELTVTDVRFVQQVGVRGGGKETWVGGGKRRS